MKRKQVFILIICITVIAGAFLWRAETDSCRASAEERLATCWIMCKPGSQVVVRAKPDKKSAERGYLDCGDSFQTDGESVDGWIRCYGAGEGGWVYCGYVVTEKPEMIGARYMCNAIKQVACQSCHVRTHGSQSIRLRSDPDVKRPPSWRSFCLKT